MYKLASTDLPSRSDVITFILTVTAFSQCGPQRLSTEGMHMSMPTLLMIGIRLFLSKCSYCGMLGRSSQTLWRVPFPSKKACRLCCVLSSFVPISRRHESCLSWLARTYNIIFMVEALQQCIEWKDYLQCFCRSCCALSITQISLLGWHPSARKSPK